MEKPILQRVKQRIREHGEAYKINQLCIDELPIQQFTPQITKLLQKCINVQYITFQNCNLKSLQNIPRFPKLQILQLGFNQITGISLSQLLKYPNLKNLNLQNNKIEKISDFLPLACLKQLTKLYCDQNPLCKEYYRNEIFQILPLLDTIDGFNRAEQQVIQQSLQDSQSEFSDEDASQSQGEQERQSPNKMKRKN